MYMLYLRHLSSCIHFTQVTWMPTASLLPHQTGDPSVAEWHGTRRAFPKDSTTPFPPDTYIICIYLSVLHLISKNELITSAPLFSHIQKENTASGNTINFIFFFGHRLLFCLRSLTKSQKQKLTVSRSYVDCNLLCHRPFWHHRHHSSLVIPSENSFQQI